MVPARSTRMAGSMGSFDDRHRQFTLSLNSCCATIRSAGVLPHDRILLWQSRCLTNDLTEPHQESYHIFKRPSRGSCGTATVDPSGTARALASPGRRSACPFRRVVACVGRARWPGAVQYNCLAPASTASQSLSPAPGQAGVTTRAEGRRTGRRLDGRSHPRTFSAKCCATASRRT